MRKLIVILLMSVCAFSTYAQTVTQQEDPKVVELRQQIGIDYSMLDFKTKKIDCDIIGPHLVGMLNLLQKYYNDGTYNWKLAAIVKEQKGLVTQVSVDKFKINEVSMKGDIISVLMNCKLSKNNEGIKSGDVVLVFDKGVSES